MVNPPGQNKYGHWENNEDRQDAGGMARRRDLHIDGWWPAWEKWISAYAGGEVPAREPGDGKLKPIEDAPGSYVRVKAD